MTAKRWLVAAVALVGMTAMVSSVQAQGKRRDDGYRDKDRRAVINAPSVEVDTAGKGSFSTRNSASQKVDRGYVDTRRQASVGLRVRNKPVWFYGNVTRQVSPREFEMEVTNSSEGRAMGTARFRLNPDMNEVELITVQGMVNGRQVNGSFNRD
jgi:hypothetical protein